MSRSIKTFKLLPNLILLFIVLNPTFYFWNTGYYIFLIFLTLISLFIWSFKRNPINTSNDRIIFSMLFILPILSTIWAIDKVNTLYYSVLHASNLILFYIFSQSKLIDPQNFIRRLVIITPIVVFILFCFLLFKFGEVRSTSKITKDSLKAISNNASAMVVLCIPFLLLGKKLKLKKILSISLWIISIIIIMMSQSRSALFLGILSIITTTLLFPGNTSEKFKRIAGLLFILIISTTLLLLTNSSITSTVERFSSSQFGNIVTNNFEPIKGEADYSRAIMMSEGIKVIQSNPFTGIGYYGMKPLIESIYPIKGIISHNLLITVWAEIGILGLVCLIFLVFIYFIKLKKAAYESRMPNYLAIACLSCLILIIIQSQFRPFYTNPMIPIFFGIFSTIAGKTYR